MTTRILCLSSRMTCAVTTLALVLAGCGTAGVALRANAADQRNEAAVADQTPRLVVAGPARLLHLDLAGAGNASVYRVAVSPGSDGGAACRVGRPIARVVLARNRTNRLNLDVLAGQAACVVADNDNRRKQGVEVAWHVQGPAPFTGGGLAPETLHARATWQAARR